MRTRLRPAHSPERLAEIYAKPHDHSLWVDHQLRVAFAAMLANTIMRDVIVGADLSCGDGKLLSAIPLKERHFGDVAPGWPITGPIEETLDQIPYVGLFVCGETIEHLDDPDLVLKKIRAKTNRLLLTTPVDAWDDANEEHYWAWSREGVEDMLTTAGFTVSVYLELDLRPSQGDYCFGIWACT